MTATVSKPAAARIPLPDAGSMTERQRQVHDAIVSGRRGKIIGPLRAALHNPELAECWQKLGQVVRYETSLPARVSELAILLVGRRWSAELEFQVHAIEAVRAGISPEIVDAIRRCAAPNLPDEADRDIYRFTRDILLKGRVGEPAYARIRERWGAVGVVELTAVIGYYSMVAMTLNAHQITLAEPPATPLEPVEGLAPIPDLAADGR